MGICVCVLNVGSLNERGVKSGVEVWYCDL